MWNDFESREFVFKERAAIIVYPKVKPVGRMILKTEYMSAFPAFDIEMLNRGYYIIHVDHETRWAPDYETDIMAEFVRFCAKELGACERVVLEGMSCGGLQAARFGELYPSLTAVMYLDAPVLNILSQVGLGEQKSESTDKTWREIVATYGVNRSTIVNFRKSPIDNMQPLIENNIPVIMLYGNADNIVVYEENGKVLQDFYRENGGTIKVISRSMGEHHPHGLKDLTPLTEFVESNFCK